MQLPPKQQNEPEWLQVQRARRKHEASRSKGMFLGYGLIFICSLPIALIPEGQSKLGALLITGYCALAMILAYLVRRMLGKDTAWRTALTWLVVFMTFLTAVGALTIPNLPA